MKTSRLLLGLALASAPVFAQDAALPPASMEITAAPLTAEQLEQLLAPIALYPDALIAIILPACTQPADVVLAARYLQEHGDDLSQVEHRAWDDSVKSLTHYPDVLKWLDASLDWVKQLGEQFTLQPAEVMNAIQRLRAKAQANGALANTPQQQVIVDQPSVIRIVPTEPDVIYVPAYDPAVVFVDRPVFYSYGYTQPLITFRSPCRAGPWLAFDFDWSSRRLWVGDRHRAWNDHHDWRRPVVPVGPVVVTPGRTHATPHSRPWSPPPTRLPRANNTFVSTAAVNRHIASSPVSPRTQPPLYTAYANRPQPVLSPRAPVTVAPPTVVTPVGPRGVETNNDRLHWSGRARSSAQIASTPSPASPAPAVPNASPTVPRHVGAPNHGWEGRPRIAQAPSAPPVTIVSPPGLTMPSAPVYNSPAPSYARPAPRYHAAPPAVASSAPVYASPAPAAPHYTPPPAPQQQSTSPAPSQSSGGRRGGDRNGRRVLD